MKAIREKFCPSCEKDLPVDCFGVSRARRDGLNGYCKSCTLDRVHAYRDRKRAEKLAANRDKLEMERLERLATITLVSNAVKAGCTTRSEIHAWTKLEWDQLGEALAELTFQRGVLRIERVGKLIKFRFADQITEYAA